MTTLNKRVLTCGEATLLDHTRDPLLAMFAQTRGTTTDKGFDAVWQDPARFVPKKDRQRIAQLLPENPSEAEQVLRAAMQRTVDGALEAKHYSVSRGVKFTFSISASRNTSKQLMRTVIDAYWEEMSQRYVKLLNRDYVNKLRGLVEEVFRGPYTEDLDKLRETAEALLDCIQGTHLIPEHIYHSTLKAGSAPLDTDFWRSDELQVAYNWYKARVHEIENYLREVEFGIPMEDARENLAGAFRTELIVTIGFEALKTFLAKRLCTRAQTPIRTLAKSMRKQVTAEFPWMSPHLTVQCLPSRICPEQRPDGCPLLVENGGGVWRASQAQEILSRELKTYKKGERAKTA